MKKDLLIVGLILCLIVSIGTHIQSYNELKKEVGFKYVTTGHTLKKSLSLMVGR